MQTTLKNRISNLDWYEIKEMGCHIDRHLNMSDSDLIHRLVTEKNKDGQPLEGATVFDIPQEELLEYIKKALLEFEEELNDWLNDDSDGEDYAPYLDCGKHIGHGYFKSRQHNWNSGAWECSQIVVVLRKEERKYDTTFTIKTCYCEPSIADKATLFKG